MHNDCRNFVPQTFPYMEVHFAILNFFFFFAFALSLEVLTSFVYLWLICAGETFVSAEKGKTSLFYWSYINQFSVQVPSIALSSETNQSSFLGLLKVVYFHWLNGPKEAIFLFCHKSFIFINIYQISYDMFICLQVKNFPTFKDYLKVVNYL